MERIVGLKVIESIFTENALGLGLSAGVTLRIFNQFEIKKNENVFKGSLLGLAIVGVKVSEQTLFLYLEMEVLIKVFLDDNAFRGPEALELSIPNEPIVVWN